MRLTRIWTFSLLPLISSEITLSEAMDASTRLLAGRSTRNGSVVKDVNR